MNSVNPNGALARNVRRLGHIDLAGAGQVTLQGSYAYVGHIPNRAHLGTTILDVSDPRNPRTVATITLTDTTSHSHKARVAGDIMIVNHERNPSAIGRRADELPRVRAQLTQALGRAPTHAELAQKLSVKAEDIGEIEKEAQRGYHNGGFKIYDVSKPAAPREITHQRTGGIGVHRFDMDERYAYISTEMEGFLGNILVIYDIRDPQRPAEVSRWWMGGQHVAGGETPSWSGRRFALHHAIVSGKLAYAAWRDGGMTMLDIADPTAPKLRAHRNWCPPFGGGTHTPLPLPGRNLAVFADEGNLDNCANGVQRCWVFDVREPANPVQIAAFPTPAEEDYCKKGAKFGPHNLHENRPGSFQSEQLIFATYQNAGVRVFDITDPFAPREVAHFVPPAPEKMVDPRPNRPRVIQSNDVYVAPDGLMYVTDVNDGLTILQYRG